MDRREFLTAAAAAVAAGAVLKTEGSALAQDAAQSAGKAKWKKAVKYGMLPSKMSDEERLTLAKECGFEGVEGSPTADLEAAAKLAELGRKIGVPFHGLVQDGWSNPLSDPNPDVIKKGMDGMRTALKCANAMGVETVLLVPAVVSDKVRYKDAYERSHKNISELIPLAEEQKAIICVENVWNKFLLSPLEFCRYIDEFNSPWVRAYYDTANSIVQGFSSDWILTLGKRLRKSDVKDYSRKEHKFVDLGDGDVNYPEVCKAFREIGYNDYLTAETGECSKDQLLDISKRMDKVLSN